jgi:hypothetical protein
MPAIISKGGANRYRGKLLAIVSLSIGVGVQILIIIWSPGVVSVINITEHRGDLDIQISGYGPI